MENVSPPEAEALPPAAYITVEQIDSVFSEVAATVPSEFMNEESSQLTDNLRVFKEKIFRVVHRGKQGEEAAYKSVFGFLFAHRLARQSIPDFQPESSMADLQTVVAEANLIIKTDDSGETIRDNSGQPVRYFPELAETFADSPETFDHLLGKFSNNDARWGAQILLLCVKDSLTGPADHANA